MTDQVQRTRRSAAGVDPLPEPELRAAVEEWVGLAPLSRSPGVRLETRDRVLADQVMPAVPGLLAKLDAVGDLLDTLWLYLNWNYVTRKITTEQKNLLADMIDAHRRRDPEHTSGPVDRWWRDWPNCVVCGEPVYHRDDGLWEDLHAATWVPGQTLAGREWRAAHQHDGGTSEVG